MKKTPPQRRQPQTSGTTDASSTEFLLYATEDGKTRIDVRMVGETVWLSLTQLGELFGRDKSVISRHIKNVYDEGELTRPATVAFFATVQNEGGREVLRDVESYSLDVIISVGYRVKSLRGTQFRMWATQRLREYLVKGFAMDDERLKERGNSVYFKELLARIREIRTSEKLFWQQVLEIYATSIDYNPKADEAQQFFATVQNKMHWAAHGHTAAEVIARRADAARPHMGLTTWKGDRPKLRDVEIAKNYLSESRYFQQTCFHSSIGVHVEKMIFKTERWLTWPFNIPPLPQQKRIVEILDAATREVDLIAGQLAALKQEKAALMAQLLTGKRRVRQSDQGAVA